MVRLPFLLSSSSIAAAIAAPSAGSVPVPISSIKTKVLFDDFLSMIPRFCIWDEKVLRAFSML